MRRHRSVQAQTQIQTPYADTDKRGVLKESQPSTHLMSVSRCEFIGAMSWVPLTWTVHTINPSRADPVGHAYLHVCGVIAQIPLVKEEAQLATTSAKPARME